MITSRDEIIDLLDGYLATRHDLVYLFWMGDNALDGWNNGRNAKYFNGVPFGKLREKDGHTMETLKLGISDDALRDEIRQNLERKIKKYAKEKTLDIYQLRILIDYKEQRKNIFCWSIDDWIKKYWGGIIDPELNEISYSETRVLAFLDYSFENYEYSVINNPYNADVSALKSAYGKEKQFCKYGLVPLKKDRILIPIDSPRIYDASLNKTFFTKNIPLYLLKILKQMMADGILTDFALRLVNER